MIRRDLTDRLRAAARSFPAITLTGPRQSGKSTLCRAVFPRHAYANLEALDVRTFATQDPRAFLAQFPKGAIIDEVQRAPDLTSYLQEAIDAHPRHGRWVLSGSQNLSLLSTVSQSLAGRCGVLHLLPLARGEVRRFKRYPRNVDEALLSGGYPRILDRRLDPGEWLGAYVGTYVERDVRSISNVGNLVAFQRFLTLCAGRTSQLINYSSLANDCGVSQPTARAWLSVLEASFIVFRLPPYAVNLNKRLVKMPKLHFYDSGLVCWLLGIRDAGQLRTHPLRGAIFESWVVSEIVKHRANRGEFGGLSFWRDQHGLEADLVIERPGAITLVEAKAGQTASGDMFDRVRRIRSIMAASTQAEAVVAYAGAGSQARSDVPLISWDALHKHTWV